MMKQSDISASYNDSLTKLMEAIGRNFLAETPDDIFNLFSSFAKDGLPLTLDPRVYLNIFPHLELFKYWVEVNALTKDLNIDKQKPN